MASILAGERRPAYWQEKDGQHIDNQETNWNGNELRMHINEIEIMGQSNVTKYDVIFKEHVCSTKSKIDEVSRAIKIFFSSDRHPDSTRDERGEIGGRRRGEVRTD